MVPLCPYQLRGTTKMIGVCLREGVWREDPTVVKPVERSEVHPLHFSRPRVPVHTKDVLGEISRLND